MKKIDRRHPEVALCVEHNHVWRFIRYEKTNKNKDEKNKVLVQKCMKCGLITKH